MPSPQREPDRRKSSAKHRQSTIIPPRAARSLPSWWVSLNNWMVNVGRHRIFFTLFFLCQLASFASWYNYYWTAPAYLTFRTVLGHSLFVARAAAKTIDLLCAIILFTVCRNLITLVRGTLLNRVIPLDKNISFHILIAWSMVFWSVLHCAAHCFNFLKVNQSFSSISPIALNTQTGVAITGQILVVSLFLITTSAVEMIRRSQFEMFWFTHHLFLVFFGALLLHGSFCFIKVDDPNDICAGGATFWKYWIASAFCYLLDRIYRIFRGRLTTYICKVISHPSDVVEIQMRKPSFSCKAGQYIFICCPEVAPFEWHPFTLTNSPYEDFVSIHMRVAGDWTRKMADRLGCGPDQKEMCCETLPFVMIDGPYGSASEDAFEYEAAILVGAGIGVTPFASILKTIWYRMQSSYGEERLKSVYFIWICRDKQAFEWFQYLLATLEEEDKNDVLHIYAYLTQRFAMKDMKNIIINQLDNETDVITRLKSKTYYGRPDWDSIFSSIQKAHKGKDIGVFFCGPKPLSKVLHSMCNKYTESVQSGTRFYYSKEYF